MEILYPKSFDSCPNCGSTDLVMRSESDKAVAAGALPKGSRIPALQTTSMLVDKRTVIAPKKCRVIFAFYDICSQCGTLYCCQVVEGEAVVEPEGWSQPRGGLPFMGRG